MRRSIMTKDNYPFNELQENVLSQLRTLGYNESSLNNYSRLYRRVQIHITEHGAEAYTKELGQEFLSSTVVSKSTYSAYSCAIRRLDDFIDGKPYRCHHGNPVENVAEAYSGILNEYVNECIQNGNSQNTIDAKFRACIKFLNYIWDAGGLDLMDLNAEIITRAVLIFDNKDNYAHIRQFLIYAASKNLTQTDFSGIIPKYKRRKPLPTTYTPDEIQAAESSISTDSRTGTRNLAIIRLATRMGLRSGDIAKLKWSEIDFSLGLIRFVQEKTGSPLELQMPNDVLEVLFQHRDYSIETKEEDYVFKGLKAPHSKITTTVIRHIVKDSLIAAEVNITNKKHGPHALRSSLASSMINDGASYEVVRKILGHTNPNVIKHYARTDIESLRLCSIDPPAPSGLFREMLSGRMVVSRV